MLQIILTMIGLIHPAMSVALHCKLWPIAEDLLPASRRRYVQPAVNPSTGDEVPLVWLFVALLASGAALIVFRKKYI